MAETYISYYLDIIQVLQDEHNQVRKQLQRLPGFYDPTESHADMIKIVLEGCEAKLGRQLREISYLKSQIHALETEKNNAKSPVVDPGPVAYVPGPYRPRW